MEVLNIMKNFSLASKCKALHFDISQTDGEPLPFSWGQSTHFDFNFSIIIFTIHGRWLRITGILKIPILQCQEWSVYGERCIFV